MTTASDLVFGGLDEYQVRRMTREGGPFKNRNGGTTVVTFYAWPDFKLDEVPGVDDDGKPLPTLRARRTALLCEVADVSRSRRLNRSYAADPDALSERGRKFLTSTPDVVKDPWSVRIYYLAAAGDQVYAEFGGLTEDHARELVRQHERDRYGIHVARRASAADHAECWRERRPLVPCRGTCRLPGKGATPGRLKPKAERAKCLDCKGSAKVPEWIPFAREDWRKVVFPSEIARCESQAQYRIQLGLGIPE